MFQSHTLLEHVQAQLLGGATIIDLVVKQRLQVTAITGKYPILLTLKIKVDISMAPAIKTSYFILHNFYVLLQL